MATPFTVFRKYTGVMMAVLCALLMFTFVLADSIGNWGKNNSGANASAQDSVVHWQGGSLNERQIGEAVRHRRILAEFQRQVRILGQRDANAAGVGDLPLRVRLLQLRNTYEQGVERDVVQTKVFAQKAQEAGMVVSDEMIVDYLRGLGRDRVSNDQMRTIMSGMQVGSGRRATIKFVFDLLREAMLANNYIISHQYMFSTILPAERWDDWLQVNDRVVIEAAPIETASYVDQVIEPTDGEIEEFFETYKERTPTLDILPNFGNIELPSPNPAFATPQQVQLQYVVAKFDDFAEQLTDEVTDEEIAQYYEENKESFVEADKALFGDDNLFDDETEEESAEETPEEDATEDSTTEQDTSNPLREEEASVEAADEAANAPAEDQSGAAKPRSPFRLVALTEEEQEEAATEETAEEPSDESTDEQTEADSESSVTYQPLEEVSDEIRRRLAQGKAADQMRELMFRLKRDLDDSYADYFNDVLDATDAKAERPAPPAELADLGALAAANNLSHESVAALSFLEFRKETLGRSVNADVTAAQPLPLCIIAFREGEQDLFQPVVTYDLDGNLYLSIITERLDRVTPKLEDIRDEVVAAWKLQQAADLADAAAKGLAAKVRDSGLSLEGYLAENQDTLAGNVVETDPFSLLTIGNISQRTGRVSLRLSQPEPLVAPGPDLLAAVFDLQPGDVGAALNHDRSIVYLLRIAARLESEDALRARFLTEGDRWFGLPDMRQTRYLSASRALGDNILDGADLVWERNPDSP